LKFARFSLFIALNVSIALTQNIYVPLEYQDAYEDGTRSLDGTPGYDYWQNKAEYKFNITLDPVNGNIIGSGTITYHNNSPDILDKIVIRCYQNLNKAGTIKDWQFDENEFTEGLNITSLTFNKKYVDLKHDTSSFENTGTNLVLKNVRILPGKQAAIDIVWDFRIPKVNHVRMGQYDSTTFFIAYWYPQIAVYDDIDEWDMNEYTGTAEFYNDFSDFDINITVPNNYGVWATGILQNPEDVLAPRTLGKYNEAQVSNTVTNIISPQEFELGLPVYNTTAESNTWHYTAKNVTDFSFGAAANYLWDGQIAESTPGSKVFVSAVYNPASLDFYEVCDVASKSIEFLSKGLPGIPFPLPKITIFNGDGGMETPMMVNMESNKQRIWMVHTVVHEVIHSYFPFYVGTNERKSAWMDEGLTQLISEAVQYELDKSIDFRARNVVRYLDYAGQFDEVPIMYPSYMIKGEMYGNHAYFRPVNAFNIMRDFVGEAQFKKALAEFIERWKGKHPSPYDLFFTFEDVTGDDLSWFWQSWFYNTGYPDLAIDSVDTGDDLLKILITKEGLLPLPVAIAVKFKDGSVKRAYRSAAIWKDEDENEIWIEMEIESKPSVIELGSSYIPDVDSTNNSWHFK